MENVNKLRQPGTSFTFCIIPSLLFQCQLDYAEIAVYCYLASKSEDFNPSVNKIAKDIKMSKTKVIACMRKLCDLRIISLVQKGDKTHVSKYRFEAPKHWLVAKNVSVLTTDVTNE